MSGRLTMQTYLQGYFSSLCMISLKLKSITVSLFSSLFLLYELIIGNIVVELKNLHIALHCVDNIMNMYSIR